ncbi:Protein of unknown function [Pyronema omphalodes CBS 100304]|uniref:Uncharacterized protein n=1 Tax=Pyronema omphalodes (strain CBS 100304) TaxID=1076935 RepID=U4LQ08_PYROM|nr:Protein of unknown function [Pyronema omphalodes CBS 100304]
MGKESPATSKGKKTPATPIGDESHAKRPHRGCGFIRYRWNRLQLALQRACSKPLAWWPLKGPNCQYAGPRSISKHHCCDDCHVDGRVYHSIGPRPYAHPRELREDKKAASWVFHDCRAAIQWNRDYSGEHKIEGSKGYTKFN